MKSTVETFFNHVRPQFKSVSDYAIARIEEGLFQAIQEDLKRQLANGDDAACVMPWGTYKVENLKSANGGNINIVLSFNDDFITALTDPKRAVYQDDFADQWNNLFADYVTYGKFFEPETEEAKKVAATTEKGVVLSTFQKEFFPNAYADMLLKAIQQHRAEGEIYRINLCDTVEHGTIEIEFTADSAVPKFEASKSFKQYLKSDEMSDN